MEFQGEGWFGVGGELFYLFLREMGIGCVSKQGLKKVSLINVHSFIAEVKLNRRWRPRRGGGCLTTQEATW